PPQGAARRHGGRRRPAARRARLPVRGAEERRERDARGVHRFLARPGRDLQSLAMALDGADRMSLAETWGMHRQTLRDWVHRYNAEGLTGLYDTNARALVPSSRPNRWLPWRR